MIFYFLKDDILFLHAEIIREYGGSDGIRDEGLLESAISAPLQTFASNDLYPTIVEKIARLSFGLAMDHPFIDGNKRIAAKALDVGLSANNIDLRDKRGTGQRIPPTRLRQNPLSRFSILGLLQNLKRQLVLWFTPEGLVPSFLLQSNVSRNVLCSSFGIPGTAHRFPDFDPG